MDEVDANPHMHPDESSPLRDCAKRLSLCNLSLMISIRELTI